MYHIIINPEAGKGRSVKAVAPMEAVLKEKGIDYKLSYTEYPGHAIELTKLAVEQGCSRVISIGGDGTLREIAQQLVHTDIPLATIPAGTGNDFAKTIKVPNDYDSAAGIAVSDDIHTIDVLKASQGVCINIACIGLDAYAVYHAAKYKRWLRGIAAYFAGFLTAFIKFKPVELAITMDDGEPVKGRHTLFVVANGMYYGGGFKPVPMASLQNGYIDMMQVVPLGRLKIIPLLAKYVKGTHVGSPVCSFHQCKKIRIESEQGCIMNIDGEIYTVHEEEFTVMHSALKIVAPLEEK